MSAAVAGTTSRTPNVGDPNSSPPSPSPSERLTRPRSRPRPHRFRPTASYTNP